jgi:hypothetical protein
MIDGKKMLGRVLERIRFEGTSNKTYVMKNTISTSEYWLEVSLRSTSIPATFAFPTLGGVRLL